MVKHLNLVFQGIEENYLQKENTCVLYVTPFQKLINTHAVNICDVYYKAEQEKAKKRKKKKGIVQGRNEEKEKRGV